MPFRQPNAVPMPYKGSWAYVLLETYWIEVFGILFCIPAGVVWDGASIPRALWTTIGLTPDGLHRAAALLHDCLFQLCGVFCGADWNRRQCNEAFREVCLMAGESRHKANLMYLGLKLGSWTAWRKYARIPDRKLTIYEVT